MKDQNAGLGAVCEEIICEECEGLHGWHKKWCSEYDATPENEE